MVIYQIKGGGQAVRQAVETKKNATIQIEKVENSTWPLESKCNGQDSYTNVMWAEDIETLKRWANGWAGKKCKFAIK